MKRLYTLGVDDDGRRIGIDKERRNDCRDDFFYLRCSDFGYIQYRVMSFGMSFSFAQLA